MLLSMAPPPLGYCAAPPLAPPALPPLLLLLPLIYKLDFSRNKSFCLKARVSISSILMKHGVLGFWGGR
jgi:hypothetical protein